MLTAVLTLLGAIVWEQPYRAGPGCQPRTPAQMDVYATTQWTHHCASTVDGIVRERFYYVFGEPARTALLRVDLRPSGVALDELRAELTRRFGPPDHAPELMEIGFRHLRYGQPVAGDHWRHGPVHYFLHANQSGVAPLGVRTGVQLIVLHDRLFRERLRDDFILRVDGIGTAEQSPPPKGDPIALLLDTSGSREDRAGRLLEADAAVLRASVQLSDNDAGPLRRALAGYGVKLGGQTHQGGLDYRRDLLWNVWREFPDTDAGERAFLALQNFGWHIAADESCPADPDLFRTVIEKGEAFLTEHPSSRVRLQVLHTVAVAYESWWSIAHAPPDDGIVVSVPYPRKAANARQAEHARTRAIELYREVARLAPESPEAAAALRRLPRLELKLDTGQRRFFCFYC
jgi:hypothetical protein